MQIILTLYHLSIIANYFLCLAKAQRWKRMLYLKDDWSDDFYFWAVDLLIYLF